MALSFARIHRANLINFGILPVVLSRTADLARIQRGDQLIVEDAATLLDSGETNLRVVNVTQGNSFDVGIDLDEKERGVVVAGGLLNHFGLRNP